MVRLAEPSGKYLMRLYEFAQPIEEGVNDPGLFKAVFVFGPPGAGKNTVIRHLGLNNAGLKLADTDDIRVRLDALKKWQQGKTERKNQQFISLWNKNMLGLIINVTGRDVQKVQSLKTMLERLGYDTFGVFVDVDREVAWNRVQTRQKDLAPDHVRYVTPEYFDDAYPQIQKNRDILLMMFGSNASYLDNNSEGQRYQHIMNNPGFSKTMRRVNAFLRRPVGPTAAEKVAAHPSRRNVEPTARLPA